MKTSDIFRYFYCLYIISVLIIGVTVVMVWYLDVHLPM